MGNVQSTGQEASHLAGQLANRHGFQILRVHPNSPVSEVQVFPYFDYIIAINGVIVTQDLPNIIGEMARNHVNKPLKLSLYNSRRDEQRDVTIVPRTGWGGEGLLGCSIRFCPLDGVRDRVWHILNVHSNSPAERAGLKSQVDYIIASPDFVIRSESDFYELITQNTKKPVKLIVFSSETDSIRQIEIVPDFEWGGEGCVGCDIGTGMLHWIPAEAVVNAGNVASSVKPVQSVPTLSVTPVAPVVPASPIVPIAPVAPIVTSPIQQLPQVHPIQSHPAVQPQVFAQSVVQPQVLAQPVVQPQILAQPVVQPQVFAQPITPPIVQPQQPIAPVQSSIQPIAVAAPTSRPVFDTLSMNTAPVQMQQAPLGPPIPQHPPQPQPPHVPQQISPSKPPIISTAEFVFDDIPKPNFTVSSDLFNSSTQ